MPAIQPYILEPIWEQFRALLPEREVNHPLGCHRPRIPNRVVFEKLVQVLVFGCAYWRIADEKCSATTLRRRRDEWIEAGVMDELREMVLESYDRFLGLELTDLAVDCCITKAPCGGEMAGSSPVDRGKGGIKRSMVVDACGIPLGIVIAPANRHDAPLLDHTLNALQPLGELPDWASVHLDLAYDSDTTYQKLAARGLRDVTRAELLRYLTQTEAGNGFANRFLWLLVRRSKLLPRGGEWYRVDKASLASRILSALEFGSKPVEITMTEGAWLDWEEVYGPLSEGKAGMFGAVTGRSEAQVRRLAALYAVLDESSEIEPQHLEAALALWQYAEDSARYIFGDATGDPIADTIHAALKGAGADGMSRTEISNLFKRHVSAERIGRALTFLLETGRAERRQNRDTGGRPSEWWFAR